ncbi:hypothetical protein PV-S19_0360 [Pacmanvirus S19]|nr:hypothetical protein PV-S19_0360 [Pacmanvirus S19]
MEDTEASVNGLKTLQALAKITPEQLKVIQRLSEMTPQQINTIEFLSSLHHEHLLRLVKLLKIELSEEKNEVNEYETDLEVFDNLNKNLESYLYFIKSIAYKDFHYRDMNSYAKKFVDQTKKCKEVINKYKDKKFYAIVNWCNSSYDCYWVHPIAYYTEENFPYDIEKITHAQKSVGLVKLRKQNTWCKFISFIFFTEENRISSGDVKIRQYHGNYNNPCPNLTIFDAEAVACL